MTLTGKGARARRGLAGESTCRLARRCLEPGEPLPITFWAAYARRNRVPHLSNGVSSGVFRTAAPTRLACADPRTHSNVCARDKPGQLERAPYGHAAARHFHAGAFSISLTTGTERSTATSSAYHGVTLAVATTPSASRVSRGRELRARVESTPYTRYDVPAECAKQAGSLQPGGSIMGSPQGVWWVTRVGLP